MHFAGIALFAGIATALPSNANSKEFLLSRDVSAGNMTWVGEVLPGAGEMTLVGSAEDIETHILGIDPDFKTKALAKHKAMAAKRDPTKDQSITKDVQCDFFPDKVPIKAGQGTVVDQINRLFFLGVSGTSCSTTANQAYHVACSYDHGIYVVDTSGRGTTWECSDVGTYASRILGVCGDLSNGGDISGHIELINSDGATNNIDIHGNANC